MLPVIFLRSSNERRKVHALAVEIARKSKLRVVVRTRQRRSKLKSILGIHDSNDVDSESESDNDSDDDKVECGEADNERNFPKDKANNKAQVIAEYHHGMLQLEVNDVEEFAIGNGGGTRDTGEGENRYNGGETRGETRYMNEGGENADLNGGRSSDVNTSGGDRGNHGSPSGGVGNGHIIEGGGEVL